MSKTLKIIVLILLVSLVLISGVYLVTKNNDNNKVGNFTVVTEEDKIDDSSWLLHSTAVSNEKAKDFNDLTWKKTNNKRGNYEVNIKDGYMYIDLVDKKNSKVLYGRKYSMAEGDKDTYSLKQECLYNNETVLKKNKKIKVETLKPMDKAELVHPNEQFKYLIVEKDNAKADKTIEIYNKKNILIFVEKKNGKYYYKRFVERTR